jgi:hypothetical protein
MSAVGVKVAVQVMPPLVVARVPREPFATLTSSLLKSATASLKAMVTVAVSPILSAVSLITTDTTLGAVWSSV